MLRQAQASRGSVPSIEDVREAREIIEAYRSAHAASVACRVVLRSGYQHAMPGMQAHAAGTFGVAISGE